jgi:hypothetical protein
MNQRREYNPLLSTHNLMLAEISCLSTQPSKSNGMSLQGNTHGSLGGVHQWNLVEGDESTTRQINVAPTVAVAEGLAKGI